MNLPRILSAFFTLLVAATSGPAQTLTSPRAHFGFAIGDDYQLATYTQTEAYFKKIAVESPRAKLVDIGKTEEGRTQWMVVISSPENIRSLPRYQEIGRRLARAEGLGEADARSLAAEGKAIVWIDGGLHASETVGAHQLIETIWQLASAQDAETLRILRDVIVLCAHANPDGQELVSNWYLREPDPARRTLTATPRLYQKYIGHDNNRDFFMSAMKETTNINRQLYLEWFPQIVYNHHQSGPAGTVIFVPPFRDPFNFVFDPLVVTGVEALGNAIQGRFHVEGKPGATSRSGSNYSTWWNGGLRTTAYFHNMIGLLTEIVGSPTPMEIPFLPRKQVPSGDHVAPIAPQRWRFRQSIEYSVSANRAVLDYASRQRDTLLYNIYRMGRNSIERGSRDHWTTRPSRVDEIVRVAAEDKTATQQKESEAGDSAKSDGGLRLAARYHDLLRQPDWRDPRAFIIPADQADFPTAVKFINALVKTGIGIGRASADFTALGRRYPKGSFIVRTNQAFRAHILDMFEPQDHPNDFKYPGAPPTKPYDVAGWTLALQMGVQFDRALEPIEGPFERLPYGELQTATAPDFPDSAAGFAVSHAVNDAFVLVNRLLKEKADVYWLSEGLPGDATLGPGAIYIPNQPGVARLIRNTAQQFGFAVRALAERPRGAALKLAPIRVALWDRYEGSMPSGWTRWVLEQFEFPFQLVFAPQIDAGNLRDKFDAMIFVSGAVPDTGKPGPAPNHPRLLPPEFAGRVGRLTAEKSVPKLSEFLNAGGAVVTLGSSTALAYHLGLPVRNALQEVGSDGSAKALPEEKFYVPGSVLEVKLDLSHPVTWGMGARAHVYFERSPAFALTGEAATSQLRSVAWYDSAAPLRSGWAWGQKYLKDSSAVISTRVGSGQLYLLGSEVLFRAQTHGAFKLLFNALYLSTAQSSML